MSSPTPPASPEDSTTPPSHIPDDMQLSVVWKFPMPISGCYQIQIPSTHRIIHVGTDPQGDAALWAVVDPLSPTITKVFRIFETGHAHPTEWFEKHVGSFVKWPYVWHMFEV